MPRVLVVDDDQSIRRLLCMALETQCFTVASAQDGDEALIFLRLAQESWVVLLDVNLPGRSGLEICADLADPRWIGKSHRVILISATFVPTTPLPPMVREVVNKPFRMATVLPLVRRVAEELDTSCSA